MCRLAGSGPQKHETRRARGLAGHSSCERANDSPDKAIRVNGYLAAAQVTGQSGAISQPIVPYVRPGKVTVNQRKISPVAARYVGPAEDIFSTTTVTFKTGQKWAPKTLILRAFFEGLGTDAPITFLSPQYLPVWRHIFRPAKITSKPARYLSNGQDILQRRTISCRT